MGGPQGCPQCPQKTPSPPRIPPNSTHSASAAASCSVGLLGTRTVSPGSWGRCRVPKVSPTSQPTHSVTTGRSVGLQRTRAVSLGTWGHWGAPKVSPPSPNQLTRSPPAAPWGCWGQGQSHREVGDITGAGGGEVTGLTWGQGGAQGPPLAGRVRWRRPGRVGDTGSWGCLGGAPCPAGTWGGDSEGTRGHEGVVWGHGGGDLRRGTGEPGGDMGGG